MGLTVNPQDALFWMRGIDTEISENPIKRLDPIGFMHVVNKLGIALEYK